MQKQPLQISLNGFPVSRQNWFAGINHDAPFRIDADGIQAHGFSHAPPHTVAHHGISHCPGNGEAELRSDLQGPILDRIREAKRREMLAGETKAFVINFTEIAGTEDPARLWEAESSAFNGDRINWRFERDARH